MFIIGNLISQSSPKQRVVSHSSVESKYKALVGGAIEISWILSLLKEIGFELNGRSKLLCDNISTQHIARNHVQYVRINHIEIDVHFVRDLILQIQLDILYYSFENQLTDVLTKPLGSPAF